MPAHAAVTVRRHSRRLQTSPAPDRPARGRVAAALVYEAILVAGVIFAASLVFTVAASWLPGDRSAWIQRGLAAWIGLVVGVYFVSAWHRSGQTLPMKTWRLAIAGPDGAPPSPARAGLRYLCAWLWFLPPLAARPLFALSMPATLALAAGWIALWATAGCVGDRRFPHDRIAGTRIVAIAHPDAERRTHD